MRASTDAAQVAIEAIRAQGRRALVSQGWAGLALMAALKRTWPPSARARAVAGTIHTDGAAVAAKLLLDTVSRETPPVSA
ncbi:hypothetical protein [Streptomyces sp. NPDC058255]|uniref:hypothetical protein n=1 Tax=Streptomyces sp. NPDC058255 TaxID=3346407 RepID=UPI0036E3E288